MSPAAIMPDMGDHAEPNERTTNEPSERLTFAEAAARLNISPDAVRMRVNRGKLVTIRVNNRPFVLWPQPDHSHEQRTERTSFANRSSVRNDASLVAALQERIDSLERQLAVRDEEIRRRDHIIAGFIERMPALTAEEPVRNAAQSENLAPQSDEIRDVGTDLTLPVWRRWWRRIAGG
jgi:hypothetical protein